ESGFNTYKIRVENAGDEGTNEEEEVTVVDLLPKGLVLAGEPQAMVSGQGWLGPGGNGNCKVLAGGVGVECARKDPLGPGSAYPEITLHVHVTAAAENPSVNVAEVKGARAPAETTKEEGKTTVTNAVPFDIAAWTVSVEDSLGNPFNQAGGHPLSVTTEILSNYTTASGGELVSAG